MTAASHSSWECRALPQGRASGHRRLDQQASLPGKSDHGSKCCLSLEIFLLYLLLVGLQHGSCPGRISHFWHSKTMESHLWSILYFWFREFFKWYFLTRTKQKVVWLYHHTYGLPKNAYKLMSLNLSCNYPRNIWWGKKIWMLIECTLFSKYLTYLILFNSHNISIKDTFLFSFYWWEGFRARKNPSPYLRLYSL